MKDLLAWPLDQLKLVQFERVLPKYVCSSVNGCLTDLQYLHHILSESRMHSASLIDWWNAKGIDWWLSKKFVKIQNSRFVNSLFMICNYVGWFKLSRHGKLIGLVFPAFQTPAVHFPQVLPEKSAFTWLTFLFSKNTLN